MQVSVQLINNSSLRQINYKDPTSAVLPSTFQLAIKGEVKEYSFLDQFGEPTFLPINGQMSFDLENPIEKSNWNNLKLYHAAYKQYLPSMVFNDPTEQANKDEIRAEQTMQILSALSERKERGDSEWLTKVFRRITGLATQGVTVKMAYTRLFAIAQTNPEKFFENGIPIYEDEDFALKSLIDNALEHGALTRDDKGLIKQVDGKVIAKDYNEAVFVLRNDRDLQNYINVTLKRGPQIVVPTKETGLSEELEALALQSGKSVETTKVAPDGSVIKPESKEEDSEMLDTIQKLVKAELIKKNGVSGTGQKFRLNEMGADAWLTSRELVGYFKINKTEYERYKSMLK